MEGLELLEKGLQYSFLNKNLLIHALTHRSWRYTNTTDHLSTDNNERLEFLGDAVLELVITEYLYHTCKGGEGQLTAVRSNVVNKNMLFIIGKQLNLENLVRISDQERSELGKARQSIVSDAVEAVIGAVYLEAGYTVAQRVILQLFESKIQEIVLTGKLKDAKTELQEYVQEHYKVTPRYKTLQTRGKDHEKEFESCVLIFSQQIASSWGKSKRESENLAAQIALNLLQGGEITISRQPSELSDPSTQAEPTPAEADSKVTQ